MIRIGVDLGGSKIEAIALSGEGVVLARRRTPTPATDYDGILRTVVALVAEIERVAGGRGAIGVGAPGAISAKTGLVKNANTIVLNGRPLAHDLARALNRAVRLENDANCFALSEAVDGAGARVVFGVILGSGVGGGIVVDGRVLKGHNRLGGEWGHNPLPRMRADEYPGPLCYCGEKGCIETYLCGAALTQDFYARSGERVSAETIAARADEGDALALDTLGVYRDRLARALASVVNVVDPDVIVLGGGVSNIARLYASLERLVERYAFTDALDTRITRNLHGDSSGVRGAAWLWGAGEG